MATLPTQVPMRAGDDRIWIYEDPTSNQSVMGRIVMIKTDTSEVRFLPSNGSQL